MAIGLADLRQMPQTHPSDKLTMTHQSILSSARNVAIASAAMVVTFHGPVVVALPIASDLAVTGSMTFDVGFADPASAVSSPYAISGTGAESGAMVVTTGGTAGTSAYSGFSVTGSNPRAATLTDLGDGIAISGTTASATDSGTFAVGIGSPTVPTWMSLMVHNNSSTVGYHLTFAFGIDNAVNSGGSDAFAHSQFSLSDNAGEFEFSDLTSDTVNGNVNDGVPGGFGGLVSDSQSGTFFYDVLPGGDLNLHGFWTLEGGSFAAGGSAGSSFGAFVNLTDVAPLGTNGVPLPGTLALVGIGLAGLAREKCKRG